MFFNDKINLYLIHKISLFGIVIFFIILLIYLIFINRYYIISWFKKYFNFLQKIKLKRIRSLNKNNERFDIDELIKIKELIDILIKEKTDFYIITEILPLYAAGKKPDKNQINDIKDKIFLEISLLLNKNTKNNLKNYFNIDGLKLYIYEKTLIYINKIDLINYDNTIISDKNLRDLLS